jgi:hypothetical protein
MIVPIYAKVSTLSPARTGFKKIPNWAKFVFYKSSLFMKGSQEKF